MHSSDEPDSSLVEVDWLRLYARLQNGRDSLLLSLDYASESDLQGALHCRCAGVSGCSGWFQPNDNNTAFPNAFASVSGSVLSLHTNQHCDRVFHCYGPRVLVPPAPARLWVQARVRVTGSAQVHVLFDHWRDLVVGYGGPEVNNKEGGAGPWSSPREWQLITVGP